MAASPPARPRRWLLPAGALLGAAAAFLSPGTSGCVYHDTEQGTWLKDIYFTRGAWGHGAPPGFTCAE